MPIENSHANSFENISSTKTNEATAYLDAFEIHRNELNKTSYFY